VIWQRQLAVGATAGDKDRCELTGLALKGTAGNSMTVAFSGNAAGISQVVSAGAYLR
jgi:hypothetical protein